MENNAKRIKEVKDRIKEVSLQIQQLELEFNLLTSELTNLELKNKYGPNVYDFYSYKKTPVNF